MKRVVGIVLGLLAAAPAYAGTTCAHDEFAPFLDWFAGSAENQKAASANPLTSVTFQAMGSSMPARTTLQEDHALFDWPVVPSLAELEAQNLAVRIKKDSDTAVRVYADATDGREVYFIWTFEKAPCWTLVKVLDGTLVR